MEDVTSDMLPEPSQTEPVAAQPQEPVSEDVKPPALDSPGTDDSPAESGSQVPPGFVPYSRFKEVNKEKKELEEQLKALQESDAPEEEVEEEDNPLTEKVATLERELYLNRFPDLSDRRDELDAFLEEKSGMDISDAVTLFRAEQGLMAQPRKGLEKVNAGPKTAPPPRFTAQDVESMRLNDPDKWLKHNMAGDFDEVTKW